MLAGAEVAEPRLGKVTSVRNEAPTCVDDVVVTYSTGRTEYIQVKLDVSPGHDAWDKMWKHFYEQFRSANFAKGDGGDLITLVVNNSLKMKELSELLRRAHEAESYQEWAELLAAPHRSTLRSITDALARKNIRVDDETLLRLCRQVRVKWSDETSIDDTESIPNQVNVKLKDRFKSAEPIFDVLLAIVSNKARFGSRLTFDGVVAELRYKGIRLIADSERRLGEYVHLLCNRTMQVQQLTTTLRVGFNAEESPSPRVFLIHGPVGQNHNSLIVRFYHTVIKKYFEEMKDPVTVGPCFVEINDEWPCMGDITLDTYLLLAQLFERFGVKTRGMKPDALTPDAFRPALLSQRADFVVVRHQIREWREDTAQTIGEYLRFWGGVKRDAAIPPCLIFLNVIYDAGRAGVQDDEHPVVTTIKQISELPACVSNANLNCFCIRLEKLEDVSRWHVENWFDNYHIVGAGIDPVKQCNEIFGRGSGSRAKSRPMMYVEPKLKEIYEKFIGA
ncbi:MAG: hypothetical protein QOJ70_2485 [Acidobacteriota bacterium]|nr:hypothetical protein [Acidobacteriota bacterium]